MNKNSTVLMLIIMPVVYLIFTHSLNAKTYTVGVVEWVPWATAYVASEKGFWEAEGLDVEVQQFSEYENGSIKAFKYGKVDFALMMLGTAIELIRVAPRYTIIYEHDWSHGGDFFILSSKLNDVAELKGKKVGTYSAKAGLGFFIDKILTNAGISINDFDLYEVSNTVDLNQAFRNGIFTAIVNYLPDARNVIRDGTGKIVNTSADFPGVIPEGIIVQKYILQDHPEKVAGFLRGWLRAVKWQVNPKHRKEYYAILKRTMFKNSSYSDQDLAKFTAGAKINGDLETILKNNEIQVYEFAKDLLLYLEKNGTMIQSSHPHDYISTSMAVKEAKKIFPGINK